MKEVSSKKTSLFKAVSIDSKILKRVDIPVNGLLNSVSTPWRTVPCTPL